MVLSVNFTQNGYKPVAGMNYGMVHNRCRKHVCR